MKFTNILGWLIFLVGIFIIGFTLYSSYNIFTGKMDIPVLFEFETQEAQIPSKTPTTQTEIQEMIMQQLKGIIPMETVSKFFNLTVWTMLAWILIAGGAQIANLGIKLIKKEQNI